MTGRICDLCLEYESGSQFLSYDNQAVEAMNLENTAEQIFNSALDTESEKKGE